MRQAWLSLGEYMAADPIKGAVLSDRALDRAGQPLFRFALWRVWDPRLPLLAVVMLNPSTADASRDDQTITRLVHFATVAGYGGFVVVNRYAYRATEPAALMAYGSVNAIGPDNDNWIRIAIADRNVLVAWGANWVAEDRLVEVEGLLLNHIITGRAFCLGYTKDGYPKHPARLGNDAAFEPWEAARRQRRAA